MPHRRRLRSASTEQLDVPTCRRSTIGGRDFTVAGAKVWNGPPIVSLVAASVQEQAEDILVLPLLRNYLTLIDICFCGLQCFDAVGWAAGRASGL